MNTCIPKEPKSALLLGIFTAFNFDDKVTETEAKFLVDLLRKRPELLDAELIAAYRDRFAAMMKRDYVSRAECCVIKDLIFSSLGVTDPYDTERIDSIPFDKVESIDFSGAVFVVTGQFKIGRGFVENYIEDMGGELKGSCSRSIQYLIVGSIPDAAWKFGSYGTKVQCAVNLKLKGHEVLIVSEENFTSLINFPAQPI